MAINVRLSYQKNMGYTGKIIVDVCIPAGKGRRKKMLFIEYPKCSTCQKAKKWLDNQKISYEDRNIVENNPTKEELKKWIAESGLPIKRFFNTSGIKYKELDLKDKLASMSEEEQIDLLASDGMLVKRPLLVAKGGICPGFKEEVWAQIVEEK